MKFYLKISGVLTKDNGQPFSDADWDDFQDKFIELVEAEKLSFGGGTGIYTEEELLKEG